MTSHKREGLTQAAVGLLLVLLGGWLWWVGRRERARAVTPPQREAPAAAEPQRPPSRVSLNGASLDDLQTLPGIGPVLAERIVAARPFERVEALKEVAGIGEITFAALEPKLTL